MQPLSRMKGSRLWWTIMLSAKHPPSWVNGWIFKVIEAWLTQACQPLGFSSAWKGQNTWRNIISNRSLFLQCEELFRRHTIYLQSTLNLRTWTFSYIHCLEKNCMFRQMFHIQASQIWSENSVLSSTINCGSMITKTRKCFWKEFRKVIFTHFLIGTFRVWTKMHKIRFYK